MILLKPYKNSEKYTICKILLFGCFVNQKNLLTLHSESLVFRLARILNRLNNSTTKRISVQAESRVKLV